MTATMRLPRVKPEHFAFRSADGRIRIGGSLHGIAAEVIDTTGAVWTMLEAADGTRTPAEIVDAVLAAYPGEHSGAVYAALEQFAEAGYMDDAAAPPPPELNAREVDRYSRSRLFYRWIDLRSHGTGWEPQVRLKQSRVVLVGLGGTGGVAALALAGSGVGHLHCVDYDKVELSNLNRQVLYKETDVGRSKVDVALRELRSRNRDIEITGEVKRITGTDDLRVLVGGRDLLLLCADQPGEIRAWANRACLDTETPWIDAGYHGPVPSAMAFTPGDGPCYECFWLGQHDERRAHEPEAAYSIKRGGHEAVVAPTAGLSGYLAAHLALALITGVPPVSSGRAHGVNLLSADDHVSTTHPRRMDCPACGTPA